MGFLPVGTESASIDSTIEFEACNEQTAVNNVVYLR